MNRRTWFVIWLIVGLLLLVCGWLIPAHLRAVDVAVIERAGSHTPGLIERGEEMASYGKLGAAEMFGKAAEAEQIWGHVQLGVAISNLAKEHPGWESWGGGKRHLEALFGSDGKQSQPFTEWALPNRARVLDVLQASVRPAVLELVKCQTLKRTRIFAPSQSAAGQAFDAAIANAGLLIEESSVSASLSNALMTAASDANLGGDSQPLEEMLLDMMSLGQRLNWGQLAEFVRPIPDTQTLQRLANLVRKNEPKLPQLFSAVVISGKPARVANYLVEFSQSGMADLSSSLRYREGGLNELLARNQKLYASKWHEARFGPLAPLMDAAVDFGWRMPRVALSVKWILYLLSGFFLAVAAHFALPAVSELEKPLQVRGFHVAREVLFALGFLLVVLLLSEPFLAQESQRVEFPFRLRLPMVGAPASTGSPPAQIGQKFMNEKNLLTLLLFFVLQGLLYTACIVKLAEIRRQRVPSRVKLKLLENEEHLFDAGLYLGFVGTIVSFILFSVGVIKLSLMAAYSSTSFGIVFVSIFKVFNLRPTRRKLLLEAESAQPELVSAGGKPVLVTQP
jgi:hypothetical protein